jgi:hypothetical protein
MLVAFVVVLVVFAFLPVWDAFLQFILKVSPAEAVP